MIHQTLSPGGVDWLPPLILQVPLYSNTRWPVHWRSSSRQISLSLRLLVLCLVRPHLIVIHYLLLIFFFKELISFIGSLDKCNTSVFNALIDIRQHYVRILYLSILIVIFVLHFLFKTLTHRLVVD